MFKHILIPTDGSELSEDAVRQGIRLAAALKAKVTGFHVVPKFHTSDVIMQLLEASQSDYAKAAQAYAERYLGLVSGAAAAAGVPCEVAWTTSDDPAGEIVAAAVARGCDLILMASHGRRGMQAVLLGSETQKVLTHSHIPVLVYR
ncbi:MAG: universal stress protein [Rhodanobacteraceae bacterium]|jgi:nucleotide-binding universal stress UspA family protein|nr:universal stress protein [Rhodanobacteraceae bacterium]